MSETPTRRLKFELEMGADDLDELASSLRQIAHDLEHEGNETRFVTSGGWGSGYHFSCFVTDEAQTGDRFRDELEAWRQERVAERRATSPPIPGEQPGGQER